MSREELFEKISSYLKREYELEEVEITETTHLTDDLGLDSLDRLQISSELERDLNRTLEGEFFAEVPTVGELVDYVWSKMK